MALSEILRVFMYFLMVTWVIASEVSKDKQKEILRNITQARNQKLSGRGREHQRKRLPEVLFGQEFTRLECGATYSVAAEGYIYFDLGPGLTSCHHALLGSKNQKCKVAVYCQGDVKMAPESDKGCEKEFLVLSDGTVGMMTGCDTFNFGKTPRHSLNGGSDIYVYMKAKARESICIAFCMEDMLDPAKYGLESPKPITEHLNYGGLEEEQCPHCFDHDQLDSDNVEVLLHAHVLDRAAFDPHDSKLDQVPGWNLPDETDESEKSIRRKVSKIKLHPMFDKETFDYDYAVLTLQKPVDVTDERISTICLPKIGEMLSYQDEVSMTVSGWGMPWENAPAVARILQKLDLTYINRRTCQEYTAATERHICAGFLAGGKDACAGDSGGPIHYMLSTRSNQYFLSGIVSAGNGCARKDQLGVYSDVQEAVQWMHFNMRAAKWCPR